jgi:hypothetical protein
VDYLWSVSHDINKHISHEAEEKQISYGNKSQSHMSVLKNGETSVVSNVNYILAADNTCSSRSVRRSERSTQQNTSETRPKISSKIQKWINYLANCIGARINTCSQYCSVNASEVSCYSICIHLYTWIMWDECHVYNFFLESDSGYVNLFLGL